MKKTFFLLQIFFIAVIINTVYPQARIDSLINDIKNLQGKEKIDKLILISNIYSNNNDFDESMKYISEALELSKKINYKSGEYKSLFMIGSINFNTKKDKLQFLKEGKDLSEKIFQLGDMPEYAHSLIALGNGYLSLSKFDNAIEMFEKVVTLKSEQPIVSYKIRAKTGLVLSYLSKDEYEKGLILLNEILTELKTKLTPEEKINIYHTFARYFMNMNMPEYGIDYYKLAYNTADLSGLTIQKANLANMIGVALFESRSYDEAEKYLSTAAEINQKENRDVMYAANLNNLGLVYGETNRTEKALKTLEDAIKIYKKNERNFSIGNSYNSIGMIYESAGNKKKALEYYLLSLEYLEKEKDISPFAMYYENSGKMFLETGKLKESEKHLKKGLNLALEKNDLRAVSIIYKDLFNLYGEMKQYEKSVKCGEQYEIYSDSLKNIAKLKEIAEQQTKFKIKEKEKEILILKKEKELDNLQKNFWIGGFVFLFAISGVIFNQYRLKNITNKKLNTAKVEIEKKNRKIITELDLAKNIQTSLLPKSFPKSEFFEIFGKYVPSEELSGDFYEIIPLSEEELGMYIIDVCGHGVSSAMITAFVKGAIETKDNPGTQDERILFPNEVIERLNEKVVDTNLNKDEFRWYLTMFYGIYNVFTGEFSYSCGGHQHVFKITDCEPPIMENLGKSSFPVGWLETVKYDNYSVKLSAEDSVLFITDGIIEAKDKIKNEEFGYDRLYKSVLHAIPLIKIKKMNYDYLLERIKGDVHNFTESENFEDDITLFLMNIKKTLKEEIDEE